MCKLFVILIEYLVTWRFSLDGGGGGGGGPQLGGLVGCPLQGPCYLVSCYFFVAV